METFLFHPIKRLARTKYEKRICRHGTDQSCSEKREKRFNCKGKHFTLARMKREVTHRRVRDIGFRNGTIPFVYLWNTNPWSCSVPSSRASDSLISHVNWMLMYTVARVIDFAFFAVWCLAFERLIDKTHHGYANFFFVSCLVSNRRRRSKLIQTYSIELKL